MNKTPMKPAAVKSTLTPAERHLATIRLLAVMPLNRLAYAVRVGLVMWRRGHG